nr:conserved hypothetical protein [Hymenolepis microstoma]
MALESITKSFHDRHGEHYNNSCQVKSSSIPQDSASNNLEEFYDLPNLDLLNEDKNKPLEVSAKTQNTNKQIQSAATPVIRSGAMMGSLRALNNINPPVITKTLSPQPPRSNARPPSSASLQNSIVVDESKHDISFREVPLRRVQSSMELRNLTFQTWCEKRGRQYLVERRKEQLKRQQEEEEAEKLKAERSKQNKEIFAKWLAKKQQQALEARKKRLKEEEKKRQVEKSKKQLKAETEKAFEAWKINKETQIERRHSISYVNREKAAEELRAKLEKSIAAHLAFEAWQKQANQRLKEARELESVKIREEKKRKTEMEAMRKELARTSYTQWELRKAFRNQSTRSASSNQPLVAKPPWRPTSARINLPRP